MSDLAAYSPIEYDEGNQVYNMRALERDWNRAVILHEPNTSLEHTAALLATSVGPHVKKLLSESCELPDEGPHHWEVNSDHAVCFANVFQSMKLWHEEEGLRIKIAEARKELLGLEHPATLQSINDLAQNYVNQGQLNEAEGFYTEVLEVSRRLYRETHEEERDDILACKKNLASIYQNQGRLNEALPFWEDVVQGYRVSKGGNDPETLASMESLADVYRRSAKTEKADELQRDMINLMPDDNPDKPTCIKKLAEILELKEEWDAAELQLARYQEALKKVWGKGMSMLTSTNTVSTDSRLGMNQYLLLVVSRVCVRPIKILELPLLTKPPLTA
ncbi:hypothetical protein RSOLAG22IIIB_12439 [Rhizoctonia solani]|uniref:Kinesin light chain n=1 Tax=Rhizoctonia solani TaxID=456999 RepID=A0A0K6GEE7_9AGAM|nr:hypothetical protein RSOLAG22IIIB_12439 [Rhizoctonia solani]